MSDKLRARFEEEFSKSPFEFDLARFPNDPSKYGWPGSYHNYNVQCAWDGFQLGYKAAIGDADDAWADALQSDLENGVRSLNEAASNELHEKYPEMAKLGEAIRQLGGE